MPSTIGRISLGAVAAMFLVLKVVEQNLRADTESPWVLLTPAARGLVVGRGMNAAGRDLRGSQFVGQDLTGANFDGCNLYAVRIHQCGLRRASFRGAVLAGAEITDLWAFGGKTLEGAHFTELDGADFTDATINGVGVSSYDKFRSSTLKLSPQQLMSTWSYKNKDLHQCVIYGSDHLGEPVALDLRGADLRQATLRGDLSKCDLTNARIYGTTFENARLAFNQLASTLDFKQRTLHVRFEGALLGNCDFSGINLEASDLGAQPDRNFTDAMINGCTLTLTKAQLYSTASYKEGDLTGLRVTGGDLSGCDLSGINLTGCRFSHCKFAGTNFEDAVITRAWFVTDKSVAESDQLTLEQIKSTWNYKHRRMEGLRLPDEIAKVLDAEETNPD